MTYVAFIRGLNVGGHAVISMAALRTIFAGLGLRDARTLGASGNVTFEAGGGPEAVARRIEGALAKELGREVHVLVRSLDDLKRLVASEPFKGVKTSPNTRLVVTFLTCKPKSALELPHVEEGARILKVSRGAAFSSYERGARGADFMTMLEKAFGKGITTRAWDVVKKLAGA